MIRDEESGWVEPTIVINGKQLTFAEAMAVRVACQTFRLFAGEFLNRQNLVAVADGYGVALAAVERLMYTK